MSTVGRAVKRALGREPDEPFDPYELGARRSDPELGSLEPMVQQRPSRFSRGNLLLGFVALVAGVALLHGVQDTSFAAPRASCTTPAYTLNKTELDQGKTVSWRAVGPAGAQLVFAVDTTTVPTSLGSGLLAGPVTLGRGCSADGLFGVAAAPGDHTLRVFALHDGTTTVVGTTTLTVD